MNLFKPIQLSKNQCKAFYIYLSAEIIGTACGQKIFGPGKGGKSDQTWPELIALPFLTPLDYWAEICMLRDKFLVGLADYKKANV